ncbi:MAG: InlB B-repeat-containing protein [Alcanivorax sp.]
MTVLSFARRGLSALLVAAACLIAQAATAQTFSAANWEAFAALDTGSPNNQVRAMAEYQGDLYVGGTFAQVGGQQVYYVARWNGYQWEKLGDGVNNAVYAMTVYDGKLIVGGSFTTTSGVSALRIASWDGEQWAPLGDGLNSSVVDLTVYNGELIAGGIFTSAGGQSANRIARWDGSQWHGMGGPDHGTVNSLSEYNGDLIAAGSFYMVNGENHNYITRWDGSSWSSLGEGLNTTVNDAVEFQGKLYATGQFTGSGGHALPYIAVWDGSAWSAVGGGLSDAGYALYADNDKLYVGGQFETADGISSLGIAAWDGSSWQAVGDGLGLYAGTVIRIYRIAKFDNEIVLGGLLDKNGVGNLVRLNNGAEWRGFESAFLDGPVHAIHRQDNDLIVAGAFTHIVGVSVNRIARWDGGTWQALGGGFNGTVRALATFNNELYAGGDFSEADGNPAAGVARWDGQQWQPLGSGVNGTVRAFQVWRDQLYIGGDFTQAGGAPTTLLAAWTGSTWAGLNLTGLSGELLDLEVHQDVLFLAGNIQFHGSDMNLVAYPGTGSYGSFPGIPEVDRFTALALYQDQLMVFAPDANATASHAYVFNGTDWEEPLPDATTPAIYSAVEFKDLLFAAGDTGLYVYDGDNWQRPEPGITEAVNALGVGGDQLYVGGAFNAVGNQPTQNLAILSPNIGITFDTQTGQSDTVFYFADTTVSLPAAPTREGHTFTGWNTQADGTGTGYTDTLTVTQSAATLYAQWQTNSYTVSFDTNGGEALNDLAVDFGDTIAAPTPTRAGYTFLGWQPALPETMPANDLSVTAQWQALPEYTATAVLNGDGQITPASQTLYVNETASFELSLANPSDYVVVGGDCGALRNGNTVTTQPLTADCTLTIAIYPSTEAEKDSEAPLASAEGVSFRLQGGAGEKALSSVYRMRAGVDEPLFGDDADTLLTLNEDGSYTFVAERTGRYTLLFSDAVSGEITEVTIDVLPYLAFASSHRRALRDDTSGLTVWLSDEPIEYPVTATLNGSGMGFETQTVSLFENDARRLELAVPTGAGDSAALELSDLDGALAGNPVQQALTLQSDPLPLSLRLTVTQGLLMDTRVVGLDRGTVILSLDAGNAQVEQYDWQAEGLPLDSNGNQAAFNLETLEPGSYEVKVTATTADSQGVALATLQVVETCPTEGCYALAQRVPPSANPFADEAHRLALCPGSRVSLCDGEDNAYLETAGPFRLALGATSSNQSWASGEFGLGVSDASLPGDSAYLHQGVAVDFEIQALNQPGETVPVAIPLVGEAVIPAGAVWRKYLNGGWHLFLEDEYNQLHSAPKNGLGLCPVVSADSWTPGLTEGDACVRLLIQDGGPNDADGLADGVIRDPGTLAVKRADDKGRPEDLWGGGGAAGGLMVGLLGLLALRRRRVGAA